MLAIDRNLIGSAQPRAKRILPIVNPATGELCNEPTVLSPICSLSSNESLKSPSSVAGEMGVLPLETLEFLTELKFHWDSGSQFDPRTGLGDKCYSRAMMETIRKNPVVKKLMPNYSENCRAEIPPDVMFGRRSSEREIAMEDWKVPVMASQNGTTKFAPSGRSHSRNSSEMSAARSSDDLANNNGSQFSSDANDRLSPEFLTWSDGQNVPTSSNTFENGFSLNTNGTSHNLLDINTLSPMSFNLPSERTESSSSMAQSDDKSVCHSAVEQLIEAVNRLVPLHTVSVNSRQFLIDCFTPIMIEALALAHGIAMKTSRKKLDSLEKKQADLLEENREKTKRLLELENLLKSYGNQAQYVPTERFLDGTSPKFIHEVQYNLVETADLISFDNETSPPGPQNEFGKFLAPSDISSTQNDCNRSERYHQSNTSQATNKKLAMFLNRIRQELAGDPYAFVDDEELKEALKALRAEVQTLKDFPFSAVVSYVRNHLAAKYECIRSH